ncbi:MAG: hypothetical protein ACLP59_26800 [Bryobacteraceae bacterium]
MASAVVVCASLEAAAQQRGPLQLSEIEELLRLQVPDSVLTNNINTLGITFSADPQTIDRLTKDGASAAVREALRAAGSRRDAARKTPDKPPAGPDVDALFWQSIANDADPSLMRLYLEKFPHGQFAELARRKLAAADKAAAQAGTPSTLCVYLPVRGGYKLSTHFYMDGDLVALIRRGRYVCFKVTPGAHEIFGRVSLRTEMKGGLVYWLESSFGGVRQGWHLTFGNRPSIAQLKPVDGKDLKSTAVSFVPPPS